MAVTKLLTKSFGQFKGLDLESSDLVRDPKYASAMENADLAGSGALVKRPGYQSIEGNVGGIGMGVYENINTTTAVVTETPVTFDDSLYTLVDDSFTITYSGSAVSLLNIKLDASTGVFRLIITEDQVEILNQNLGVGYDEATTTTIATVISTIDALANYTASGGTVTTNSAAFLGLKNDAQLSATATTVTYKRWAQANEPLANPLATGYAARNAADFENPTSVSMNNVLYVSNGYDYLRKYDGQNFYRAGMPQGGDTAGTGATGTALVIPTDGNSGFIETGNYYYTYLYKQVDAKGNIVEGLLSNVSNVGACSTGSDGSFVITPNYITAASGFNTGCAKVNGAQSSTTSLTVDSGHTLLVGDTAYFYDTVSSSYVTRTITAKTATSITWAATTSVTVTDDSIISNNLMVGIYRAKNTGAYYLVAEVPNDSLAGNTTYTDTKAAASLGAEYITPIKAHGLPPKCKYATSHVSQLVLTGDPTNANKVYYSDIDSPEYFPSGDNSFLVDAFAGAKVTGVGSLETALIVFKDRSIQGVTGDLAEDSFRVDEVPYGGIGCAAHASIQKVGDSLAFLSKRGVYSVNVQSGVSPLGKPIQKDFIRFDAPYTLQKSTSVNWTNGSKYVLFLPAESQDSASSDYANSSSVVYAYDYDDGAWLKWTNVNAMGGLAYADDRLYFASRRLDSDSAVMERTTQLFSEYGDLLDFTDHHAAVDFSYSTHWESVGEPDVFKKYLRLKLFALPNDIVAGAVPLFDVDVDQEFNYNTPAVINSFNMDFSAGTSGWGMGAWGSFPWGDSALTEVKGKLKVVKARSMRLTFRNDTAMENVLISGYELEIAPPYQPEMKE